MPNISFPSGSAYDPHHIGVTFPADVDGERLICCVSSDALEDHFGAVGVSGPSLVPVFERNRGSIEAEARRKITAGTFEVDGGILLRTADFAW